MATKKKTEEAIEADVPEVENVVEAIASDIEAEQDAATENNSSAEKNEVPSEKISEETDDGNSGYCCYIGPTINKVIQKGSIFRGSKEHLLKHNGIIANAIEKHPLVSSLIIPKGELAVSLIKVQTKGNLLYENYSTIIADLKK